MAFSPGDTAWVCDREQHSWIIGDITAVDPKKGISATANDPDRKVVGNQLEKLRPEIDVQPIIGSLDTEQSALETSDLLQLAVLDDMSLLRCLYLRYTAKSTGCICYTYIGAIAVALNPFNFKLPHYTDDNMPKYLSCGEQVDDTLLPHTWAIAHDSYMSLLKDPKSPSPQFILVSGESGAGKTEASKIVVKYLGRKSDMRSGAADGGADSEAAAVGKRLTSCSPILESFGNAKTVRNDNSSRFGKFMKIQFGGGKGPDDPQLGVLLGSKITRYLLEKSRILCGAPGERCYHALYLVLRGKFKAEFSLLDDKQYKSLNSGRTLNNSDFDTEADFNEVVEGMEIIGMDEMAIFSVWACVGAIITLANVEFVSEGEGSKLDGPHKETLLKAASLLQVDGERLASEMTTTEIVMRGEKTVKLMSKQQAADIRDAVCKHTYDGLFLRICELCNKICDAKTDDGFWIGLLDIFGFEDFEKNSFEQLCINLANETLQGHYNEYIFKKDMEECKLEGINTVDIKCPDNTPCLQMVSNPKTGIFSLLDDEASLGKGSDKGFLEAITAKFKTHPDYVHFKVSKVPSFGIRHYAGTVTYDVSNFLEKNRDSLKDSLRLLMRDSRNSLIKELVPAPVERTGRAVTVSGFFTTQIGELMAVINSSNPHWIRCVKPHPAKKPLMFHGISTMNQLESSGVLGTVKIRKAGYPIRLMFNMFLQRFSIFLPQKEEVALVKAVAAGTVTLAQGREKSAAVLKSKLFADILPQPKMCQLGKTKVFIKAEGMTPLEKLRKDEMTRRVVMVQQLGRGYLQRRKFNKEWRTAVQRRAAELFVQEWRAYLERTAVQRKIKAERERAFREAMAEGTEALRAAFVEEAQKTFDECSADLVEVYIDIMHEQEPLHRTETERQQSQLWLDLLISLGGEMLSVNETAQRESIEFRWALLFNILLAEHVEHRIFLLVLDERDLRKPMETEMLEELAQKAGDVDLRITVLFGMEEYKRSLIRKEGLGMFAGWLERHRAVLNSSFFEAELEGRKSILYEENFERGVRKKFERVKVWEALKASLFEDEIYDRKFLMASESRYRREMGQLSVAAKGTVGDEPGRLRLLRMEETVRQEAVSLEGKLSAALFQAAHEDKLAVLVDDIEYDEMKLRRVVSESFFAQLAVQAEERFPSLYRHFMFYASQQYQQQEDSYEEEDDESVHFREQQEHQIQMQMKQQHRHHYADAVEMSKNW